MKNVFISLIIGISAGIIDVAPMLIQKMDRSACISAFIQWIVLGLIIPFVDWNMRSWLKGMLIGVLAALPVMVLIFEKEPASIIPVFLFSAILGAAVGFSGAKFVRIMH